jgi:hypothetical protein
MFICGSTCFGRHTAHHQEHKTAQPLVLHTLQIEGCSVVGRGQAECPTTTNNATSFNLQRIQNQKLLMLL